MVRSQKKMPFSPADIEGNREQMQLRDEVRSVEGERVGEKCTRMVRENVHVMMQSRPKITA